VNKLFKGIIDKLFKNSQPTSTPQHQSISKADVEAVVDAKLKEHAAALETSQVPLQDEDYTLSSKQIEYALSLIEKVKEEFELAIEPSKLTIKDLNRLIAYNRYKNKGTLINLVKKGVRINYHSI
jgi:hypothetical protein